MLPRLERHIAPGNALRKALHILRLAMRQSASREIEQRRLSNRMWGWEEPEIIDRGAKFLDQAATNVKGCGNRELLPVIAMMAISNSDAGRNGLRPCSRFATGPMSG